jgi:plasmid stabilization system protein ParE
MSFRVEVTARAHADLIRLTAWLVERSPEAAERISARFYEALPRLEMHPLTCGLAYENLDFREEIRHLLFEVAKRRVYRALFVVRGDQVKVLAVRGPGERPIEPADIDI